MANIDEIMDMLDWNKPPEIQAKGRALACKIRCINVFLQPRHEGHGKNVWDNCALILSQKSDKELCQYIDKLLEWIFDMNWPGAECIFDRLKHFNKDENDIIEVILNDYIRIAKLLKKESWLNTLTDLQKALFGENLS